jgi:histidinol-phosphate phosphatase family protein
MSSKAIFLDRDGVIIEDRDYAYKPSDIRLLPRAIEALRAIPGVYLKIIISNQSGIARGKFTSEQADKFNAALLELLKKNNAIIDKIYYCPHGPDDGCDCRKPKIGLFEQAKKHYNIDYEKSWVIGDKSSDIQAGINIGARTILVRTGYGGREDGEMLARPDYIAADLYEAVEIIKQ